MRLRSHYPQPRTRGLEITVLLSLLEPATTYSRLPVILSLGEIYPIFIISRDILHHEYLYIWFAMYLIFVSYNDQLVYSLVLPSILSA
jgi:hypothetical protein